MNEKKTNDNSNNDTKSIRSFNELISANDTIDSSITSPTSITNKSTTSKKKIKREKLQILQRILMMRKPMKRC